MSFPDILILALIAGALVLAWRAARRKGGSCSGDCSQCRRVCDGKRRDDSDDK